MKAGKEHLNIRAEREPLAERANGMWSLTIPDLDEVLQRKLRLRAAEHNRSVEEEARDILHCVLSQEPGPQENLGNAMRRLVEPFGGFELPPFPRGPLREPPDFK